MTKSKLLTNGLFLNGKNGFKQGLLVDGQGRIEAVYEHEQAQQAAASSKTENVEVIDLQGKLVLPAFVDAHCHLMMLGQSLRKVDVFAHRSMDALVTALQQYDREHPDAPRIEARNWMVQMDKVEEIDRAYLDRVSKTKPMYIMSFDLHSCLCNTAALEQMGIDINTPDPPGGKLVRRPTKDGQPGELTGWLLEMAAINFVAPTLRKITSQADKEAALDSAFDALLAAGYTAVADLLMEDDVFAMLEGRIERDGRLPLRVMAYWHCSPEKELEQSIAHVRRAKELQEKWQGHAWLQVRGVKLVVDGAIDSCTATLALPYHNGTNNDPLWPVEKLTKAVYEADSRGLQCAIHAIGDQAVQWAVDALASVGEERIRLNRHRIEHLELTFEADVERIGILNITTSVQPVHTDPAILDNWFKVLDGDSCTGTAADQSHAGHRCGRAFAYRDFLEHGAPMAIGTDAPTAPHWPLANLYNAVSRASALDEKITARTTPQFALPLLDSVLGATQGAARACHLDDVQGDWGKGKWADFNVLDTNLFETEEAGQDHKGILRAKVMQTYQAGKLVASEGVLI